MSNNQATYVPFGVENKIIARHHKFWFPSPQLLLKAIFVGGMNLDESQLYLSKTQILYSANFPSRTNVQKWSNERIIELLDIVLTGSLLDFASRLTLNLFNEIITKLCNLKKVDSCTEFMKTQWPSLNSGNNLTIETHSVYIAAVVRLFLLQNLEKECLYNTFTNCALTDYINNLSSVKKIFDTSSTFSSEDDIAANLICTGIVQSLMFPAFNCGIEYSLNLATINAALVLPLFNIQIPNFFHCNCTINCTQFISDRNKIAALCAWARQPCFMFLGKSMVLGHAISNIELGFSNNMCKGTLLTAHLIRDEYCYFNHTCLPTRCNQMMIQSISRKNQMLHLAGELPLKMTPDFISEYIASQQTPLLNSSYLRAQTLDALFSKTTDVSFALKTFGNILTKSLLTKSDVSILLNIVFCSLMGVYQFSVYRPSIDNELLIFTSFFIQNPQIMWCEKDVIPLKPRVVMPKPVPKPENDDSKNYMTNLYYAGQKLKKSFDSLEICSSVDYWKLVTFSLQRYINLIFASVREYMLLCFMEPSLAFNFLQNTSWNAYQKLTRDQCEKFRVVNTSDLSVADFILSLMKNNEKTNISSVIPRPFYHKVHELMIKQTFSLEIITKMKQKTDLLEIAQRSIPSVALLMFEPFCCSAKIINEVLRYEYIYVKFSKIVEFISFLKSIDEETLYMVVSFYRIMKKNDLVVRKELPSKIQCALRQNLSAIPGEYDFSLCTENHLCLPKLESQYVNNNSVTLLPPINEKEKRLLDFMLERKKESSTKTKARKHHISHNYTLSCLSCMKTVLRHRAIFLSRNSTTNYAVNNLNPCFLSAKLSVDMERFSVSIKQNYCFMTKRLCAYCGNMITYSSLHTDGENCWCLNCNPTLKFKCFGKECYCCGLKNFEKTKNERLMFSVYIAEPSKYQNLHRIFLCAQCFKTIQFGNQSSREAPTILSNRLVRTGKNIK